jgi:hypothetical protein
MDKETKKNIFLALFYLFLAFGLVFLIFRFGIITAVKISEWLQKDDKIDANPYETVIPAPQLYPILQATNSATLDLSGYALSNEKVDIFLNHLNVKTFEVDSEGKFEGQISLSLGINEIFAVTRDKNDNQGSPSKPWEIFYGNRAPDIVIVNPANGTLFKKDPNIKIEGTVAKTSRVNINGHLAIVDSEGVFSYPVKLNPGENKFKITCSDPAMNQSEIEWILHFQP